MADNHKINPDLLVSSLRTTLRKRRPSRILVFLMVLAIACLGMLLWYWISTKPQPGDFGILALDGVVPAGGDIVLEAHLFPREDSEVPPILKGQEITFKAIASDLEGKETSNAQGQVRLRGGPAMKNVPFLIRRIFPDKTRAAADEATLFVWPPDAKILLVEIEGLILSEKDETLAPDAAEALQGLHKMGFQIGYIALNHPKWGEYHPLRQAFRQHLGRQSLPFGPLFLPPSLAGESEPRKALCLRIKQAFSGSLVVFTGSPSLAKTYQSVTGVGAVLISKEEKIEGMHYASWKEVQGKFAP